MPSAKLREKTEQPTSFPQEERFTLHDLDWSAYRQIADALTHHHVRLSYYQGTLELSKVCAMRGNCGRLLSEFVSVLTQEIHMPIRHYGDMTCERADLECAIEADESLYLENEPLVRPKEDLDFTVDPPPDLAVEIDLGRRSRNRMKIYGALAVPEVWRFDGESVCIHKRGEDGQHAVVERSPHFPFVSGNDLSRFLGRRKQMDDNALARLFRLWVREQIRASEKQA